MISPAYTLLCLILLAPTAAFALGFLQPLPGAAVAALALGSVFAVVRRTAWRVIADRRLLAVTAAVALILTVLSGLGHFFWQADDWTVRDAILSDLVNNPWPVIYEAGPSLLRAPLGMYLIPALAGKLFGLRAADVALLLQNAALFGLTLYIFARTAGDGRTRWIALSLFVAFSGMDCIPWALRQAQGFPGLALPHIEAWSGFFQYSSNVTHLFWAPHHALAGWALVVAYLAWREQRLPALLTAPVWAGAFFWSPLAAAGAVPLLGYALLSDLRDGKLELADFDTALTAALPLAPILIYLNRDSGSIEKGFIDFSGAGVVEMYAAFLAFEALPYLAIAWHGHTRKDRRGFVELGLVTAALLLIPVYKIGFVNDFAMRASIPALALLCWRAAPVIAGIGAEPVRQRALMLAIVALGAATPAVEIVRNVTQKASPLSACNVVESLSTGPYAGSPLSYYIAAAESFEAIPGLFRLPSGEALANRNTDCWPGRRFVYEAVPAKK